MTLRCGELKPVPGGGDVKFRGYVRLWDMLDGQVEFRVHPRADQTKEDRPAFEVFYAPSDGVKFTPAGNAWLKHGDRASDFLSITFDHPRWGSPLNLTAWGPESAGEPWNVVWSRPRERQAEAA